MKRLFKAKAVKQVPAEREEKGRRRKKRGFYGRRINLEVIRIRCALELSRCRAPSLMRRRVRRRRNFFLTSNKEHIIYRTHSIQNTFYAASVATRGAARTRRLARSALFFHPLLPRAQQRTLPAICLPFLSAASCALETCLPHFA